MLERVISSLQKITWVHTAIVVAVGAAFFYFTLDTTELDSKNEGLQASTTQVANLRKKVEEARNFEREYEAKKKHYASLVNQLQQLQGALPKQFYLPDLLSDILKESKQLEIEITQIKPDEKEEQKDLYNSLGFNIEYRGTFVQLFIFLDRMSTMKRLINVVSFSITKDSERPAMTLGGEEGAFASRDFTGGKGVYPGIKGTVRVVTYRYRGGESAAPKGGT